jgi:RNA polymerase primary sigma factor
MHYLKHVAWKTLEYRGVQGSASAQASVDSWDVSRAWALMKAAQWHRDLIVRSNTRLVVSIVRRLPVPQAWHDDLVSDGLMALLRAVDKFDPRRGYRFCTYATPVVQRECYKFIGNRRLDQSHFQQPQEMNLISSENTKLNSKAQRARWIAWRTQLVALMKHLNKREQVVIRSRFGLGVHRSVKTLQRLADALKISKERVRQIEKEALAKLRNVAQSMPISAS